MKLMHVLKKIIKRIKYITNYNDVIDVNFKKLKLLSDGDLCNLYDHYLKHNPYSDYFRHILYEMATRFQNKTTIKQQYESECG